MTPAQLCSPPICGATSILAQSCANRARLFARSADQYCLSHLFYASGFARNKTRVYLDEDDRFMRIL